MINRRGMWWQLWMVLAVLWTVAIITSGWLNLPRAQHVPHDPQLLSRLSSEAVSILAGPVANAKPVRGALVWSEDPRSARMVNGTRLTFPAITTDERVAFVESEYRQLLSDEADSQRGPYLLEFIMLWLAPLFITGLALQLFFRRDGHLPNYSVVCSAANGDVHARGRQSLA